SLPTGAATTVLSALSLHDALPISPPPQARPRQPLRCRMDRPADAARTWSRTGRTAYDLDTRRLGGRHRGRAAERRGLRAAGRGLDDGHGGALGRDAL